MDKEPISSIIIYLTNSIDPIIISNIKNPAYSIGVDFYYIYDGDHLIGEFRNDYVIGIFIEENNNE